MSQNTTNFKNSDVRGSLEQYTVNGSYTRNTGRTYHQHNAPTYHYTTNANGAPVVNGAFNGVQYNISSPSQNRPGENPYSPVSPSQYTQEPDAMEDFPQSHSGSQDNRGHQTRSGSGDSATDFFESYNQTQWGPAGNQYQHQYYAHPRPGPDPHQQSSRSYTTPMPPSHSAHSYNPYQAHPWSDPNVPQHPRSFDPPGAEGNEYSARYPDRGARPGDFATSNSSNRPHNPDPPRRDTNPFRRRIEEEKRNTEKPQAYFQ